MCVFPYEIWMSPVPFRAWTRLCAPPTVNWAPPTENTAPPSVNTAPPTVNVYSRRSPV